MPESQDTQTDRLAHALELHRNGDLEAAEEEYRAILAADTGAAEARYRLGLVLDAKGRALEALGYLESANALRNSPRYLNNLGMILGKLGRFEEALVAYRQALSLLREYPEALNNLGIALDALGRSGEAAEALNK